MFSQSNQHKHKDRHKLFQNSSEVTTLHTTIIRSNPFGVPGSFTSSSVPYLQRTLGNQILGQSKATSSWGKGKDRNAIFPKQGGTWVQRAHSQLRLERQSGAKNESANRTSVQSHVAREERFNLGRGGHRFDAELDRSQHMLTLKMNVTFNFDDSLEPWPSPELQTQWQTNFINTVQNRWSFRYYLVPDQLSSDDSLRRVITRIQVRQVTSNPHFTINIRYASAKPTTKNPGPTSSVSNHTHTADLDIHDTTRRPDISQVPAEHEFGHMLGLPHVRCNSNARRCYGVTSQEKVNVMGYGANVSARDYGVFAEAIYFFTGKNWHATSR